MGRHNLLVLSDIHLGSDLVEHVEPEAPTRRGSSEQRDRELAALLDWYRENRKGTAWRLIIAGDFIDFSGMSLSPKATAFGTDPTREEEMHGLGNAVDHTLYKLGRVAECHLDVFTSLAKFVAAGNELVIVHGNHDVEFHWPEVRSELVHLLAQRADIQQGDVSFKQWFHYERDRVYIEHGHQYDPYCSHDHVLNPRCPKDPRRSSRSVSDILVRFIVRPTRGLTESGHDHARATDYLRFAARLGFVGLFALARRFFGAVWELWQTYRAQFSQAARAIALDNERALRRLSRKTRVKVERLRRLAQLQAAPLTRSLSATMSGVMVDRIVTVLAMMVVTVVCWALISDWRKALSANAAAVGVLAALSMRWKRSRRAVDPSSELRERACHIAGVFPAAFVIMGHTHIPERSAATESTTYVNLGAWATDDEAEEFAASTSAGPSRTHLVVIDTEGKTSAELFMWSSDRGPVRYWNESGRPATDASRPRPC